MRARAFHIMDPRGVIEMLLVFLEERGDGASVSTSLNNSKVRSRSLYNLLSMSSKKVYTYLHPFIYSSTHISTGVSIFY